MKVSELIDELMKCDQDAVVEVEMEGHSQLVTHIEEHKEGISIVQIFWLY